MTEQRRPLLIVVAGPNGSGKTSLTDKLLMHEWIGDCVYVNPDRIANERFGDWNSPQAVLKAVQAAEAIREDCLRERKSLAFETVLSAPDKIDFIRRAREAGYFIRVFFVGTDSPAINAMRIVRRVMEGGHDVPIMKIISRYSKSIANCIAAASLADRTYVYDNSVEDRDPVLLFKVRGGLTAKIYTDVRPWARAIFQALPPAP